MRGRGIRHIQHLWRVRRDFSKRHLFKALLFGWWPLPDRVFKTTPLLPYLREQVRLNQRLEREEKG